VDVLRPQKDEEWGARTFDLFDPSGNTIFCHGTGYGRKVGVPKGRRLDEYGLNDADCVRTVGHTETEN
jgi:hypothetical protein